MWDWSLHTGNELALLRQQRSQIVRLCHCLSSSSCSISSSCAVKGREVPAAWAGTTCRWENGEIRNERRGQLNLSSHGGCSQWRLSRDQCKGASGSGHWQKQWPVFVSDRRVHFKLLPKAHRHDGRTGGAEAAVEGEVTQMAWPRCRIMPFKYSQVAGCPRRVCMGDRQRGMLRGRVSPPLWLCAGEGSEVTQFGLPLAVGLMVLPWFCRRDWGNFRVCSKKAQTT